jgi:hypothetical protein
LPAKQASHQHAGKKTVAAFMMNGSKKQLSLTAAEKEGQRAQKRDDKAR